MQKLGQKKSLKRFPVADLKIPYLVIRRYKGRDYYYWVPKPNYFINGQWLKCPLPSRPIARKTQSRDEAVKDAMELNRALEDWRKTLSWNAPQATGTLPWLIGKYKASSWFKQLKPRTQKEYGYILNAIVEQLIEKQIEGAPLAAYSRQHARQIYHYFSEKTPRKAQLVAALCRIIFNFGIEIGEIAENPFENLRIRRTKARELTWLDFDNANLLHKIEAVRAKALEKEMPSMALAIDLALYTSQRQGDILALAWSKYNGSTIKLRQSKTGTWVEVPVMPQLKREIDKSPRNSPVILVSERTKKPYTKDHFGDVFREIRKEAGIEDELQFRDIRKTSCVMLKLAGCTIPEIAAISGHSNAELSEMMEVYLPHDSKTAENAIKKLKRVFGKS